MIAPTSRVGLLAAEPLPQIFGALRLERQTCVLRLALAAGPAEVYLTDGHVVSVELPGYIDRLGELLASGGAIDAESLRTTLATPRLPGQRIGRLLVDSGRVPEAKLQAALRLQIRRRLHRLFFADDGEFVIEPGEHQRGEGTEVVSVDLRPAIVLGVRSGWTDARYGAHLPNTRLRLTVTMAELQPFQLQPSELQLLQPMEHGPCTVTQLVVAANDGGSAQVRPTVYALFAAGAIVREGASAVAPGPRPQSPKAAASPLGGVPAPPLARPPSPWSERAGSSSSPRAPGASGPLPSPADLGGSVRSPLSPPAPLGSSLPLAPGLAGRTPTPAHAVARAGGSGPSSSPDAIQAAARAITDKRAAIDGQDLFEVLGVSREAGRGEIKAAYLEAARLYHPDRLSAAGLLHLREAAEHIFRRVSDAHSTLTDDARRASYLQRLDAPPELLGEQAKAQRLLSAEMLLMEGDVALKRRDFPTAIERLAEAVQQNPDEGEAIALLAWARFSAGQAGLLEQRADFERAVAKSPRCARAHYYLGMVRKQARESHAAISSFRRAAELDSRLAEAASELRVLSLRATRELPTMQRPKSFLDRLLKK